jgi:hypothetical protein
LVGVYCLVFPSGHYYFGQSERLRYREAAHLSKLRKGTHDNKWMLAVFKKYGPPCLRVECLCDASDLNSAEQMYLDEHYGRPLCLNLARYADCPARGRAATAEERETKRRQGKESWANGTNALRNCIGMNTRNVLDPKVRAKALAARRTPENRAMQAELRTRLHQEPEFKEAHRAGVARHRANEDQQQARLEALRIKHQDQEFTDRRIALCRAACQKAVECVETGQTWTSATEWKKWIKEEYGVVVNLTSIQKQRPYKGQTYRYIT